MGQRGPWSIFRRSSPPPPDNRGATGVTTGPLNEKRSLLKPTGVRWGVLGFARSLSLLTYLDRVCIARAQGEYTLAAQQFQVEQHGKNDMPLVEMVIAHVTHIAVLHVHRINTRKVHLPAGGFQRALGHRLCCPRGVEQRVSSVHLCPHDYQCRVGSNV